LYAASAVNIAFKIQKAIGFGYFYPIMLSAQQIQILIEQNQKLQTQVQELEEILQLKDDELELLRQQANETTALRSELDLRLEDLVSMQNQLGQQQRKTAGAQLREEELHQELTDSVHMLHQQSDLQRQVLYANTQLVDLEEQVNFLKQKNESLQDADEKIKKLEDKVENLEFERDILLDKIESLENG
jgi:DNA repair exonuclease SbcCD ATPase subunit